MGASECLASLHPGAGTCFTTVVTAIILALIFPLFWGSVMHNAAKGERGYHNRREGGGVLILNSYTTQKKCPALVLGIMSQKNARLS